MWFATCDVSPEKDKVGCIFCRDTASAALSFPVWVGLLRLESLERFGVFFKKSLAYISEVGPADESFLHCVRKMMKQ